ncbi:MAG: molybdopterin-binding protein [Lachnospiraceae bacterium]|nr:molybdopterin-binding protein [Lachnospiraceae bacterium]
MEKIRVEDAVGMPLCHDITAMRPGFKGALFKRGHVIEKKDIQVLLDIGKKTVYAGEPDEGMIHEDDCAIRLSEMTKTDGTHFEGPSEGKMLLFADRKGMFRVDTDLLNSINRIGDITISTIPDHFRVEEGDRLASMRIVPLFTDKEQIERAEGLCADKRLFELLPYKPLSVGIVITGSEVYSGRISDMFEPVVRKKLKYFPGQIKGVKICDDDISMITAAAEELMNEGADLLIFTGGMSVDPDDLTPGAIKRLGAEIISYGLPAQPGNMTLVAYLDDIPILGVPGAAISLPTTMFDVLLPQVYTGIKFTKKDLIGLGDGGLCRMCKECHFPNCTFGRY